MLEMEFTTTACCRPEIFRRTLESFTNNLKGVDFENSTIHINIDPLPEGDKRLWHEVYEVAQKYFRVVHPHMPMIASFPKAVKWCWLQPVSGLFFHLEDDWELKTSIHIDEMISLMLSAKTSAVNLRAYPGIDDDRICLSPCLMLTSAARALSKRMSITANPERQLRAVSDENPEGGKHDGYTSIQYPKDVVLRDIGRVWLMQSGWKKTEQVTFTTWERET